MVIFDNTDSTAGVIFKEYSILDIHHALTTACAIWARWVCQPCFYICIRDAIQQKVHKVGRQNFTRDAFKENKVEMIKIVFLQKVVDRDI